MLSKVKTSASIRGLKVSSTDIVISPVVGVSDGASELLHPALRRNDKIKIEKQILFFFIIRRQLPSFFDRTVKPE
jgi:phosphate/sulfate permease